jgi:outer membrane protein
MKNRTRTALAIACVAMVSAFAAPSAHADDTGNSGAATRSPAESPVEGGIHAHDVLVRLRGISIMPQVGTSSTLSTLNVNVNNAVVPEIDFTYMIRDSIGVELILATSRHQVTSNLGALGGVNVLPPTLLLQYHFNHQGKIRPYVGAGVNYTYFYNDGLNAGGQSIAVSHSSFGPALQAGVDVQITKTLFVNADIKKIWMRTDATLGGAPVGTLRIDPLVVGLGVGMKF